MSDVLRQAIRQKLAELVVYSYSDGAVLFDVDCCTQVERARLDDCGMLDALARILSEVE
jgi:hypothetical protein